MLRIFSEPVTKPGDPSRLKRRSHINAPARAADKTPDFSRQIRAGLP